MESIANRYRNDGAPIRQDRIETSAHSEVVTVKLQSTAMNAIMIGPPRRNGRLRLCAYGLWMPCPAARRRDQAAERRCRMSLGLLE
jgi:hypothetical protein